MGNSLFNLVTCLLRPNERLNWMANQNGKMQCSALGRNDRTAAVIFNATMNQAVEGEGTTVLRGESQPQEFANLITALSIRYLFMNSRRENSKSTKHRPI